MRTASIRRLALVAILLLGGAMPATRAAETAATPAASAAPAAAPAAPAYSRRGADTCIGCHDDKALMGLFRTPHGKPGDPRSPFGHGQLQCESCHGPGDAHARGRGKDRPKILSFGKGSGTPAAQQDAMCLTCHQKDATHWATSAHSSNEVACADCHRSHAPQDPMRRAATQTEACGTCHQTQVASHLKASYHPLREGKMTCTSCHAPHGSTAPAALVRNTVTETCTTCHSDLRGPFLWEHQPVAESCTNCHQPHGSNNPAMLTVRQPFLCQTCHQASGHPSLAYGPGGLPGRGNPNPFLLANSCANCHTQVHGSNHPSGRNLMR